ncbi:hypothetical protein KR084_001156, partial [Drosophila pseudotakahashii]
MLLRIVVLYLSLTSGKVAESSVTPLRYNLTILTHLRNGVQSQYEGIAMIDIKAMKSSKYIYLNARDLNMYLEKTWVTRWVTGHFINTVEIKKTPNKSDEVQLILRLPLRIGETYTLYIFFTGGLTRPKKFGYFSGHYERTPQILYALTRFEPDYAHTVFPCFDNPLYRTPFNLTMVHHKQYTALSNMPAIGQTPHDEIDDYVWTTFMGTPPLATYQIMWALHRLDKVSSSLTATGENVTVWARWQLKEKLANLSKMTPELLPSYETLFAQPLPNGPDWGGKFDQLVIPGYDKVYSGKGLMVFGEIEVDPTDKTLVSLKELLAELLARQWNGLLVSASDWDGGYVRDGINKYLALQALAMPNKGEYNKTHLLTTRLDVLIYDSLLESKAIAIDVRENGHQKFRKHKMCLITHMIRLAIGEKGFFEGLQEFVQLYANSSASTKQLWEELQRAARRTHQLPLGVVLTTVMDSWLQQPGYPVLTVLRDDKTHKVTVTQSRYFQRKMTIASKDCWWVPVIYISKKVSLVQMEWLGCQNKKAEILTLSNVVDPEDWLLLNVDAAAPLRVLYDLYNWRLITEALLQNFTQIPELSRAQLVDDALNLAWSGQLQYSVALSVIKYLPNETSIAVWQTALTNLEKLQDVMRISTGYRIFKLFMRKLIEPSFKETLKKFPTIARTSPYIPTPLPKLSVPTILYRLACQFEITECLTDAQKRFKTAMDQKSISSIPVELQETVLCRGIRNGLEDHWQIVRDMFLNATEDKEKSILLNSLACTTEYWAMQKVLSWALDDEKVPKTLTVDFLAAVMHTYLGFYVGNQFLIDNLGDVLRRNEVKAILNPFIKAVTTKEELAALQDLLKKTMTSSMASGIDSMLEPASDRVNWRKYNYFDFLNAIRNVTL